MADKQLAELTRVSKSMVTAEQKVAGLRTKRLSLIEQALADRYKRTDVADAVGISYARLNQLVAGETSKKQATKRRSRAKKSSSTPTRKK